MTTISQLSLFSLDTDNTVVRQASKVNKKDTKEKPIAAQDVLFELPEFRKKESWWQRCSRVLDERNSRLPAVRPALRMNKFKHQIIVLAQLKRFWLTIYDVAEECEVTTRTAKKLLAWAQAHYHIQVRIHEETAEKEYKLLKSMPRSIRSRACFYECCEDIRNRDNYGDLIIAEFDHGTHMWREIACEFHVRSAFRVGEDCWAPIGEGAPAELLSESEAINWVCSIPFVSVDDFKVKEEDEDEEEEYTKEEEDEEDS
jgi:hypothetical protein